MSFPCRDGVLHAEGVPLPVIADAVGTPVYVYSTAAIRNAARRFRDALSAVPRKHLAFAVKANPAPAILSLLAQEGYGADIVSKGELDAALGAGMGAGRMVFSGVGKTEAELCAGLDAGIGRFNLELEQEGEVLSALAVSRGVRAPALLRINPDVDAHTHAKITTGLTDSKFGIPIATAAAMYDRLARLPGLDLHGVAVHIGSQIIDMAPLERASRLVGDFVRILRSRGHVVSHVDLGGGLGVSYQQGQPGVDVKAYGDMVAQVTRDWDVTLLFEPGRYIAAEAGMLLTRVVWVKPAELHPFVIIDAAMNDLARPALYDAWHDFSAVKPSGDTFAARIAGPICETGDVFSSGRVIDRVERGDLAVLHTVGAYGAAMASTYNSRALVPEVIVDGARFTVISERVAAERVRGHVAPHWIEYAGRPLATV